MGGATMTQRLDMSGYRPFREMATTCRCRPIKPKEVVWLDYESPPFIKGQFRSRQIGRADVPRVAELWRHAYPEVYGSPHEFILFPEEYESLVALKDTWEEDCRRKRFCIPVVEEIATGRLVGAALLAKEDKNLQVEITLFGVHPDYRERGITYGLGFTTSRMIEKSGAEYLTTFLETWHDITQKAVIRGGWRIAGIFPGNFTRWKGGQQEYRGCAVHCYRYVGEAEEYATRPEEWTLAPEVRELWECLERINRKIQEKSRGPDREAIRKLLFE